MQGHSVCSVLQPYPLSSQCSPAASVLPTRRHPAGGYYLGNAASCGQQQTESSVPQVPPAGRKCLGVNSLLISLLENKAAGQLSAC